MSKLQSWLLVLSWVVMAGLQVLALAQPVGLTPSRATNFTDMVLSGDITAATGTITTLTSTTANVTTENPTTLNVGGGTGSTGCTLSSAGNITCDGNGVISGTLNVTGTLSNGGNPFSGAIRMGSTSAYTSGVSITHGGTITPTKGCAVSFDTVAGSTAITITSRTITTTGFSLVTSESNVPMWWVCGW